MQSLRSKAAALLGVALLSTACTTDWHADTFGLGDTPTIVLGTVHLIDPDGTNTVEVNDHTCHGGGEYRAFGPGLEAVLDAMLDQTDDDGRFAAACLVAHNVDTDGRVTPQSCYRGFEGYSFGQKKVPSPFATAWVRATLRPFDDLADEITEVEVLTP